MIDHISLKVSDISKSKEFYVKALGPLGYTQHKEFPEWNLVGMGQDQPVLWIQGNECKQTTHLAFTAKDKAGVDAFYKAALEAGGTGNGLPGYRKDYSPGYYASFILDPDGHNIEVVYRDPNPSE